MDLWIIVEVWGSIIVFQEIAILSHEQCTLSNHLKHRLSWCSHLGQCMSNLGGGLQLDPSGTGFKDQSVPPNGSQRSFFF